MPSYLEDLNADPARYRVALEGLIAEQVEVVTRMESDLRVRQSVLDRAVLRLVFIGQTFGRATTEATVAQREAEEFNTPVIELSRKLERQRILLQAYRNQLSALDAGYVPAASEDPGLRAP